MEQLGKAFNARLWSAALLLRVPAICGASRSRAKAAGCIICRRALRCSTALLSWWFGRRSFFQPGCLHVGQWDVVMPGPSIRDITHSLQPKT